LASLTWGCWERKNLNNDISKEVRVKSQSMIDRLDQAGRFVERTKRKQCGVPIETADCGWVRLYEQALEMYLVASASLVTRYEPGCTSPAHTPPLNRPSYPIKILKFFKSAQKILKTS
jgi:hypothetical protein